MAKKQQDDPGQAHLRNFMGEGQRGVKVASTKENKYTQDDVNELILERANEGRGTNTKKPDQWELDNTYGSEQQGRFNKPYAYPPKRDETPTKSAPPTGAEKKAPPSGNYPPTPGDKQEWPKNWNIPSDYDLG